MTYDLSPGIDTFEDVSEILIRIFQSEFERFHNTVDFEFDDIRMKKKLILRHGVVAVRFDEKSFFNSILGFNPNWNYKHYNQNMSQ